MKNLYFFIIGMICMLGIQLTIAQSDNSSLVSLNHIGISVPDIDEAVEYYTEIIGFKEAFRSRRETGETWLVYLQMSKNTFLEIQANNANQNNEITHFGVQVDSMDQAINFWRSRGVEVEDARKSGNSKAILSNTYDENGIRMEIAELTPDSLPFIAMESWVQE
ncbi:MAG: VOC family protein [Pseudomonadota bacterium]|nr:VOC family protein [Pseudomonadota bacterium]|tara:strand:- start:633 stop:1124 length:492 start_codon:yes stop_codon:yes gene_type:complete